LAIAVSIATSGSGLSVSAPRDIQSRVAPDQARGLAARALV
jgi:hypothetical protein